MAYGLPQVQPVKMADAFEKGRRISLADYKREQDENLALKQQASQAAAWAMSQPEGQRQQAWNYAVDTESQNNPKWEQFRDYDPSMLAYGQQSQRPRVSSKAVGGGDNIVKRVGQDDQGNELFQNVKIVTTQNPDGSLSRQEIAIDENPWTEEEGNPMVVGDIQKEFGKAGAKVTGAEKAEQTISEDKAERLGHEAFVKKAATDKQGYRKDVQTQAKGLKSQLRNIDRAISALEQGAKSGIVTKNLPTFTKETAELESAAKALGIDVINSATFGALSEKELELALSTAVPMELDEPELLAWLKDKRNATEKLRGELVNLSQFLGKRGNTLDMWEEMQKGGGNSDPLGLGL